MPRREAVGRSISRFAASPLFWASLVTSVSWWIPLMVFRSFGPHVLSSARLSLWIVYWYWDALWRPPIRTSWTAWRTSVAPATVASLGRSLLTIWTAVTFRWDRGLRALKTRPVFVVVPPPAAVNPVAVATAGSDLTIPTSVWIFCFIDWNEVSWSAMMLPFR